MGLPIWRDPQEKKSCKKAAKPDATACLRSSIRRRPSVHGRRDNLPRRVHRELPPLLERSPPPSVSFDGLAAAPSRGDDRGVPPISNLLEAAYPERTELPLPPPAPETRIYADHSGAEEHVRREAARWHMFLNGTGPRDLVDPTGLERRAGLQQHADALRRDRDSMRREGFERDAARSESRRNPPAFVDGRNERAESARGIALHPDTPLHIIRETGSSSSMDHPQPQNESSTRSALPTPPRDTSGPEEGRDNFATSQRELSRHPLGNTWTSALLADAIFDGLGDRDRSPSPGDGWAIIRTTITPDEAVPSAESSFTSAAASRSFNTSSSSTHMTELDGPSLSSSRQMSDDEDDQSDSRSSSIGPEDLVCLDDDLFNIEASAQDFYRHETSTPEGQERIAAHQRRRREEGNRFAYASEPADLDIGFRLIEEALETDAGHERLSQIRPIPAHSAHGLLNTPRGLRDMRRRLHQRVARHTPSSRSHRFSDQTREAVQETRSLVQEYFQQLGMDSSRRQHSLTPPASGHRQLPPITSDPTAATSPDDPEPRPVSPPTRRSEREASEALLSGDVVQELDSMRRIVERLAARDDVPEQWWMSMGLNVSRPRSRNPRADREIDSGSAVRSARVEHSNPRL